MRRILYFIGFIIFALTINYFLVTDIHAQAALEIVNQSDNKGDYPNSQIPRYNKFEVTFDILNSVAGNYQFPYDPSPPNGIDLTYPKYNGISVDAYFLPPGETDWNNAYSQPAFYYKEYDYQLKDYKGSPSDWYYPTGGYVWKVRFSPDKQGTWQYKLKAIDALGSTETLPQSFDVTISDSKGFLKVSQTDPRYFEYDDGTVFFQHGMQSQLRFDEPIVDNKPRLEMLGGNRASLIRTWTSGLYGAAWPEWLTGRNIYDGYLPRPGVLPFRNEADGRETMTVHIDYEQAGNTGWFDSCMWQFWDDPHAVKRNTDYQIRVKYRGKNIQGPRDTSFPNYGLVMKTGGGWNYACYDPSVGTTLTNYGNNNADWGYLDGTWNSGDSDWLTKLYLLLENVIEGDIYVDSVSVREDLGSGQYGPEIINDSSFEYELYYPQPQLWALDQSIALAEANGVYVKMVIGDKSDKMWWKIDDDGTYVIDGEPDNQTGYYGNWYNDNKTRWLHRAWWRQLQARYGYSTALHSWEFTNEGDPNNGKHWSVTDLLGRYMKCQVFGIPVPDTNNDGLSIEGDKCVYDHPNSHMVTTSFWHSFPANNFWGNTDWPNVDYADVHKYSDASFDPNHVIDTASFHLDYSSIYREEMDLVSNQNGITTKPIVRGEVGLSRGSPADDLLLDIDGIWLHNFIWATVDPGAMYEIFWQLRNEIFTPDGPDGQPGLYEIYKYFTDFISAIPLNNGNYQDALASLTDTNLRVTGQKDIVNNRAHVWIQNKGHTWRKVVDGNAETGLSGTVTISGFTPNATLPIEWHEFETDGNPNIVTTSSIADANGNLTLDLPSNSSIADVGIKIGNYDSTVPSPTPVPGDADGNGSVDGVDYVIWLVNYFTNTSSGSSVGDFDGSGTVDGIDYVIWLNNYTP
jgi:hypothetical protein